MVSASQKPWQHDTRLQYSETEGYNLPWLRHENSLYTGSSNQNVTFAYIVLLNPTYIQKVSEYDQEIPQSHTEDHPTAPRGRVTEHSQ